MKTETFKGCEIPERLTIEGCEAAISYGKSGKSTRNLCCAIHAHGASLGCFGIFCGHCILGRENIGTLIEYASSLREPGSMPELNPGMLIQKDTGEYILVVSAAYGYRVTLEGNSVVIETKDSSVLSESRIVKVWYGADEPSVALHSDKIRYILRSNGGIPSAVRCWVRPKPAAKKMTVDEVSKALGYTVEIVGNEKADD